MTVGRPIPPTESPYNGSWINGNTGEWHPETPQSVIDEMHVIMRGERRPTYVFGQGDEMPETAEELVRPERRYSSEDAIERWQFLIHDWAIGKGFWEDAPNDHPDALFAEVTWVMSKLMLKVSELGEACEALRKGDRENFAEELADTVIRILDTAEALDIHIASEMVAKMESNETRPHKHGKRA